MLDKKRKIIRPLNLSPIAFDVSSERAVEYKLISNLLEFTRQNIKLPALGEHLIGVLNQHPLLTNKVMTLWSVNSHNNVHFIASQNVYEPLKKHLHDTIRYDHNNGHFLKINSFSLDDAMFPGYIQTDIYLEKTPQCLFGISFWFDDVTSSSKLATVFFQELFGLLSLVLLKVSYLDLLHHHDAQKHRMTQLRHDGERHRNSQKKNYEALLRHQASYDPLTNLPNRFYGCAQLERCIDLAQKKQSTLALLFLDLDEFKHVNDSMGHAAGDELLKIIADRYLSLMRETDTLVRLGGDEFMIIVEDLIHEKQAEELAKKCQELSLIPFQVEGEELFLSSSIGIAMYPEHGTDAKTLMSHADAAMYQSKMRGRNSWSVFVNSMTADAARRIRIKSELHYVVHRDELSMNYQPIINMSDKSVFAVEALLRWESHTLGSVSPDQIIPIAEETGLIVPIGYWLLKKVCEDMMEWRLTQGKTIKVAVNISIVQLKQMDFVDQVQLILEATGVPPEALIFEITESAFVDDSALILSQLKRLNKMNIDCSLDDFGMGYSSLSYLRSYPFKTLKIDRVFIQGIETNDDDLSLVNSIITMSRNLKLSVIAEGIETSKQLELLSSMNCDMVQGWYFAKAMNSHQLQRYLDKK
jgi:diguanylate cyclase (GGDEF)-like protein